MAVFLTPDNIDIISPNKQMDFSLKIFQYFLTEHNPNKIALPCKRSKKIIGITLHNTDWITVSPKTTCAEQYTRATVNGNMRDVRVHYYVDNQGAWFNLPWDYESWHAGSKRLEAYGSEAGNAQTLSIECIMDGSGKQYDLEARDNAAKLIAYLLFTHNLTIDNLYTHNYWANVRRGLKGSTDYLNMTDDDHKHCPIFIRPEWLQFKDLVSKYLSMFKQGSNNTKPTPTKPSNSNTIYRVQVGAFTIKANAELYKQKVIKAGFNQAYITTVVINGKTFYRVQIGAFKNKSNAIAYRDRAIKAGFKEAMIAS